LVQRPAFFIRWSAKSLKYGFCGGYIHRHAFLVVSFSRLFFHCFSFIWWRGWPGLLAQRPAFFV
jgi:hypothetical protein